MQNEITVSPLVDILSEQLGEQVVMNGDKYVYHAGLLPVNQNDVDVALLEYQSLIETNSIDFSKTSLMTLCDKKQDEVQKLVLGYKATPMQLERYKDKYERAKAGEFDQALNDLIILNHEQYLTTMRNLVDLIEYFRSEVDDMIIAGSLDQANEAITKAELFDETTTLDNAKSLLLEVKNA